MQRVTHQACVPQARDLIEDMAVSDAKRRGWFRNSKVWAKRRLLQVCPPIHTNIVRCTWIQPQTLISQTSSVIYAVRNCRRAAAAQTLTGQQVTATAVQLRRVATREANRVAAAARVAPAEAEAARVAAARAAVLAQCHKTVMWPKAPVRCVHKEH